MSDTWRIRWHRKRKRIPRLIPAFATALGTRGRGNLPYTRAITRYHHLEQHFERGYR